MLGLLDRATQLTNLRSETLCAELLTCEAALKTTTLAATERAVTAAGRPGLTLGVTIRVLPAPA
jgi:hypothetical protein